MTSSTPSVIFLMADYGHDPTETALPYQTFKSAHYTIHFATETGHSPTCDSRMLTGLTQKLLGAAQPTIAAYESMKADAPIQNPLAWTDPSFSLDDYDLVFLPGGHDKGVRQVIDSEVVHKHLAAYVPQTLKPGKKALAAVCHGVMVLSESVGEDGKSVISDMTTTALVGGMEQGIFWATRLWLGDYYKTYGAGSESVETSVKSRLADPEQQWKGSMGTSAFVVEDPKYNYISARFPGDVPAFSERIVSMMREIMA